MTCQNKIHWLHGKGWGPCGKPGVWIMSLDGKRKIMCAECWGKVRDLGYYKRARVEHLQRTTVSVNGMLDTQRGS